MEGQKATVKICVTQHGAKVERLLTVLTEQTPNAYLNIKIECLTQFCIESHGSCCVSLVGNTFSKIENEDLYTAESEQRLCPVMYEDENTDEDDFWDPTERFESFMKMIWEEINSPVSKEMSDRVVDVTNEQNEIPQLEQANALAQTSQTCCKDSESLKEGVEDQNPGHAPRKKRKISTKHSSSMSKISQSSEKPVSNHTEQANLSSNVNPTLNRSLPGGLTYSVLSLGNGMVATLGKRVKVRYEGRLAQNGKRFDNGVLEFTLGAGEMIKGFDLGVRGMLTKEKRRIFIPSRLGYGKEKVGSIPPNSNLIFEVTLISIA